MQSSPGPSETDGNTPLRNPFKNLNCLGTGQKEWKKWAIAVTQWMSCRVEREKQPRGNGEQAAREEVTGNWKSSGKMNSLGKTVYEEFISGELLAIRKARIHSSSKKRCKQSLGKRTNFKVNLMATESFLFISNMTGFSINSHICKDPVHLK